MKRMLVAALLSGVVMLTAPDPSHATAPLTWSLSVPGGV